MSATATSKTKKTAAKASPKAGPPAVARKAPAPANGHAGNGAKPLTKAGTAAQIKTRLEAVGKGLYDAYTGVADLYARHNVEAKSHWWNLGKAFLFIEDQWRLKGVRSVAEAVGLDVGECRLAIRFAKTFTLDEILSADARAAKQGGSLDWQHYRLLLAHPDSAGQWVEVLVKEKMDWRELMLRLQASTGGKKGGRGGRKFNIPITLTGQSEYMLRQVATFTKIENQFLDRFRAVTKKLTPARYTPEILTEVRSIRSNLDNLAALTTERAEEVTIVERQIEAALGAATSDDQAEANKPAPAAGPKIKRQPPKAARAPLAGGKVKRN